MLDLPGVTLVCADTANHALALRALAKSREGIRYARTLFLTDAVPAHVMVPQGIEVGRIAPLASRDAYSEFVLKALAPHVDTPHALACAVGRIRGESRGVGPRIPRVRLPRCKVVLVRRRDARGQRRILAALAQAPRSAARPPHRPHRRRGRDDWTHVPAAARERARHSLRDRSARRPLFVRSGVSDRQAVRLPWPVQFLPNRSAGRDCRTGPAVFRRHRTLAATACRS